ncbi:MAG: hotdog domain-containing protein [Litorimonas sp.]
MKFRTRKMVKPGDLNGRNTLFGGRLLEWIDEECAIYCACQMQTQLIVTKYISEINFLAPAFAGEVIEIGVDTVSIGLTSLTVCADVRNKATQNKILTIDRLVFVAVNEFSRPTRHALASQVSTSGARHVSLSA